MGEGEVECCGCQEEGLNDMGLCLRCLSVKWYVRRGGGEWVLELRRGVEGQEAVLEAGGIVHGWWGGGLRWYFGEER